MGDNPALVMEAGADGLAVVVHETTDSRLTYTDFAVFQRFVAHKDFATALADHAARGLPETGFKETYRRHAKSLIAVGSGAGADRAMGLAIEIVALANPYTDDLTAGLPVLVLLDGAPRGDAQVELFRDRARRDGDHDPAPHRCRRPRDPAGPAGDGISGRQRCPAGASQRRCRRPVRSGTPTGPR